MARILYFIPGPFSRHRGAQALADRRDFLQSRAAPGTVVEVWDALEGPAAIETEEDERLAVPVVLDGCLSWE